MSHTISQKTLYRGVLVVAILAGCVIDRAGILRFQAQQNEKHSTAIAKQQAVSQEETFGQKLETETDLAMKRASLGCVTIRSTRNNKPIRFDEKVRVFDPESFPNDPKTKRFDGKGNPINGVRPMPSGVVVCNIHGDTAVVGQDGFIGQIYRVAPSKLSEFKQLIGQ
ncbi:MAG: hypothetical protein KME13_23390 [Myxacorys californica WJT36-NPBG1]|jgi:hypothetical protein|nr:hypothetical protein [Myxacorys californica WJT36-NPBG1]